MMVFRFFIFVHSLKVYCRIIPYPRALLPYTGSGKVRHSDKEVDKQNKFFIYNCFCSTIVFCFASIKSLHLVHKFIYRPTMHRTLCELARPRVNIGDQFR